MDKESKSFLKSLLGECGPSGFEQSIQKVWMARTKKYAENIKKDVHGNAIAVLNPKAECRVMLAGHCDEIGFIISNITEQGVLNFLPIGGLDSGVIPGSQVKILTKSGLVDGVIGKKAIHMMTPEERKNLIKLNQLYIDIGAKDKKDAEKTVSVGDAVAVAPNFIELKNNVFSSKGCDDRTGAYVVSEVLKILHKNQKQLKVAVYSVSTVQEEVGLRGATTSSYGIAPHAAIAVDVGHATDTPDAVREDNGEIYLGKGPIIQKGPVVNPVLGDLLFETAKKKKIPNQVGALGRPGGTDTGMIQLSREGVATALISIPNRYMHTSVECCSFNDVQNAAELIAQTILSMKANMDFTP